MAFSSSWLLVAIGSVCTVAVACGGSTDGGQNGFGLRVGGASNAGGNSAGDTSSTGGNSSTGGETSGSGGAPAGGATSVGGAISDGGAASNGGTSGNGGATSDGGAASNGGTSGNGGATGAGGTATDKACKINADCGTNGICGFSEKEACGATTGQCFPPPGAVCDAILPGCACDGTEINTICTGLPNGYTTAPLAHSGACDNSGTGGTGSGTFACGPTLHCTQATQYCKLGEGGACCNNSGTYSCEPIPDKCNDNPGCDCIKPTVGGQACTDNGGVMVTFFYP